MYVVTSRIYTVYIIVAALNRSLKTHSGLNLEIRKQILQMYEIHGFY